MKSFALAILPALVAASPLDNLFPRDCDANNCLRAVRQTASFAAHSADCASYFEATVTPATSTVYQTLTFTATATDIQFITATSEVPETASAVLANTIVQSVFTTLTSPSTTVTVTDTIVTNVYGKRQATVIPSSIPSYASACSGAVGYSSACSCIGAVGTTSTAAAPVTTVTVSTTVTPATQTIPTTVATDFEATTVTTLTSTALTTEIASLTVTDATPTTVTATATSTALADVCTPTPYVAHNFPFSDTWTLACGQTCSGDVANNVIASSTQNNIYSCLNACEAYPVATVANYNFNTGDCVCYDSAFTFSCSAATGWNSGYIAYYWD